METTEITGTPTEQASFRRHLTRQGFGKVSAVERWERRRSALISWIEVNQPDAVDDAVAGLLEWSHIADRAIVTTVPGEWKICDRIRKAVPHLQIIPGLKTNDPLDRFDDVDGWKDIGAELSDMAKRCGSNTVVLENETAVGKYGLGEEVLDWGKFREAMEYLPKNLRIIWYPGITGNNYEKQDRMEKLCRIVAKVHGNVTIVDLGYSRPAAVNWHWSKEARKRLDSIGAPTIPMLYVQGSKKYWQYHEIHKALGHVANAPSVIIFPGAHDFRDAAIEIRKALEVGG